MGNCSTKKSKLSLEKLESDILMVSSDNRRQLDQLCRELIMIKQAIRKKNYDDTRRFTVCCSNTAINNDSNKSEYI